MQSYKRLDFALWFTKKVTFGQWTLFHKYTLSAVLYKPQHRTYLELTIVTTSKCRSGENQSNRKTSYQEVVIVKLTTVTVKLTMIGDILSEEEDLQTAVAPAK